MAMRKPDPPPVVLPYETAYKTFHTPLLEVIETYRLSGESAMETLRRILTHEALARSHGQQAGAAKLLRVSIRVMNCWCADLGLRPIDRKRKEEQHEVAKVAPE